MIVGHKPVFSHTFSVAPTLVAQPTALLFFLSGKTSGQRAAPSLQRQQSRAQQEIAAQHEVETVGEGGCIYEIIEESLGMGNCAVGFVMTWTFVEARVRIPE